MNREKQNYLVPEDQTQNVDLPTCQDILKFQCSLSLGLAELLLLAPIKLTIGLRLLKVLIRR